MRTDFFYQKKSYLIFPSNFWWIGMVGGAMVLEKSSPHSGKY
jgi:hypothetical protein